MQRADDIIPKPYTVNITQKNTTAVLAKRLLNVHKLMTVCMYDDDALNETGVPPTEEKRNSSLALLQTRTVCLCQAGSEAFRAERFFNVAWPVDKNTT